MGLACLLSLTVSEGSLTEVSCHPLREPARGRTRVRLVRMSCPGAGDGLAPGSSAAALPFQGMETYLGFFCPHHHQSKKKNKDRRQEFLGVKKGTSLLQKFPEQP